MSQFSDHLIEGMKRAVAFAEGNTAGAVVHTIEVPDVALPPLENWEQGRRAPDAPSAAYLQAIARCPQTIQDALSAAYAGQCGTP